MAGTWVEVARKPDCDVCREEVRLGKKLDQVEMAYADCRIPRLGVWGYVCKQHFEELDCTLGVGNGQILRLIGEGIPNELKARGKA